MLFFLLPVWDFQSRFVSVVCIRQVTLMELFTFSILLLESQYCAVKLLKVISLK